MQLQRSGDFRRESYAWPCAYAGKHTTENQRILVHGISEREKCAHDVWQARKPEIQIWESSFWVRGILCQYGGMEWSHIKKYIQDQEKADIMQDKLSVKEYEDPFKGQGWVVQTPLKGQRRVKSNVAWTEPWEGCEGQASHGLKRKASALRRSQVGRAFYLILLITRNSW